MYLKKKYLWDTRTSKNVKKMTNKLNIIIIFRHMFGIQYYKSFIYYKSNIIKRLIIGNENACIDTIFILY